MAPILSCFILAIHEQGSVSCSLMLAIPQTFLSRGQLLVEKRAQVMETGPFASRLAQPGFDVSPRIGVQASHGRSELFWG
jgi:hypothetical protein